MLNYLICGNLEEDEKSNAWRICAAFGCIPSLPIALSWISFLLSLISKLLLMHEMLDSDIQVLAPIELLPRCCAEKNIKGDFQNRALMNIHKSINPFDDSTKFFCFKFSFSCNNESRLSLSLSKCSALVD